MPAWQIATCQPLARPDSVLSFERFGIPGRAFGLHGCTTGLVLPRPRPLANARLPTRAGTHGVSPFIHAQWVQPGDARQAVEVGVYRDDPIGAHALHHGRMQEVSGAYPRMAVRQPGRHLDIGRADGFDPVVHHLGEFLQSTSRPNAHRPEAT